MRLLDVQPRKSFSYIFVQFPGMKMNVPMLANGEGKAVKEDVALCVQLNSKEKVNGLYLVRTQSIKPFDFTVEGLGAKAFYRVIRKKETSLDPTMSESQEIVSFITEEVSVVQKKTETGYHFVLILNEREIAIVAAIEEDILQAVAVPSEQQTIEEKEPVAVNSVKKENKVALVRRTKKKKFFGVYAFGNLEVAEPIRILLEGAKRKVAVFSPAALDFIGPGDYNHTHFLMRGG